MGILQYCHQTVLSTARIAQIHKLSFHSNLNVWLSLMQFWFANPIRVILFTSIAYIGPNSLKFQHLYNLTFDNSATSSHLELASRDSRDEKSREICQFGLSRDPRNLEKNPRIPGSKRQPILKLLTVKIFEFFFNFPVFCFKRYVKIAVQEQYRF